MVGIKIKEKKGIVILQEITKSEFEKEFKKFEVNLNELEKPIECILKKMNKVSAHQRLMLMEGIVQAIGLASELSPFLLNATLERLKDINLNQPLPIFPSHNINKPTPPSYTG